MCSLHLHGRRFRQKSLGDVSKTVVYRLYDIVIQNTEPKIRKFIYHLLSYQFTVCSLQKIKLIFIVMIAFLCNSSRILSPSSLTDLEFVSSWVSTLQHDRRVSFSYQPTYTAIYMQLKSDITNFIGNILLSHDIKQISLRCIKIH